MRMETRCSQNESMFFVTVSVQILLATLDGKRIKELLVSISL